MSSSLLLITPLVAAVLVVLAAVAALPTLLLASPAPQPRDRGPQALAGPSLHLVRSGRGVWFVNGQPMAESSLARLLQQQRGVASELRFLTSGQLPAASVSASLAWLRQQSGRPVALDLPAGGDQQP